MPPIASADASLGPGVSALNDLARKLKFLTVAGGADDKRGSANVQRVGVVDGAIGGDERLASLATLFPHVSFQPAGSSWPDRPNARLDILIVGLTASNPAEVEAASRRLRGKPPSMQVIVVLRDADVLTARQLARDGAADVLPAPVAEPALALSLERLLTKESSDVPGGRPSGEVVAFLKAGGGVGATTLAAQMAALLARRDQGLVCLADLDLQFGMAALYLDLGDAVTVTDCLGAGAALEETPFATALAKHRSGACVLAAPHELTPLEALAPPQTDTLIRGLKRDFSLTLLDLPSVWTAWTNRALHLADRIVLVTHLTVPNIQLVQRQLRVLASQNLEDRPVILVCNSPTAEQQSVVSVKTAERHIGRPFDVVIPEDRKVMTAAINQGLEISAVRRGTKLEKAIGDLADRVAAGALAPAAARRR